MTQINRREFLVDTTKKAGVVTLSPAIGTNSVVNSLIGSSQAAGATSQVERSIYSLLGALKIDLSKMNPKELARQLAMFVDSIEAQKVNDEFIRQIDQQTKGSQSMDEKMNQVYDKFFSRVPDEEGMVPMSHFETYLDSVEDGIPDFDSEQTPGELFAYESMDDFLRDFHYLLNYVKSLSQREQKTVARMMVSELDPGYNWLKDFRSNAKNLIGNQSPIKDIIFDFFTESQKIIKSKLDFKRPEFDFIQGAFDGTPIEELLKPFKVDSLDNLALKLKETELKEKTDNRNNPESNYHRSNFLVRNSSLTLAEQIYLRDQGSSGQQISRNLGPGHSFTKFSR